MAVYAAKEPVDTIDPETQDGTDDPIIVPYDPDTEEHPTGWQDSPEFAMIWDEKKSDTFTLQTLRNHLNVAPLKVAYQSDKQALFQTLDVVNELAGDVLFDPDASGIPGSFSDEDGDGYLDKFLQGERNIEITEIRLYEDISDPDPDTAQNTSDLLNPISGSEVIYIDGTTSNNTTTFIVDPTEQQSYTNDLDETADEFGETASWEAHKVNIYGQSAESGVTTITFQYTRGDFDATAKSTGSRIFTKVKGTDGNDYFQIGLHAKLDNQTEGNNHDLSTIRLLMSSSLAEGTYNTIAEENWILPSTPNSTSTPGKNRDLFCVVWLPVTTYDDQRVRFVWEVEFDVGAQTAFLQAHTPTVLLQDNANGISYQGENTVSRVGLYLHNPKQINPPIALLAINYTLKGTGANVRYSHGLPITSGDQFPDFGATATDSILVKEDITGVGGVVEGMNLVNLMEGTLLSSGNLIDGETYVIATADTFADFTNTGAGDNLQGTSWTVNVAGGDSITPTRWGNAVLLHLTDDFIDWENLEVDKPLCIWFICKKDFDANYTDVDIQALSSIKLYYTSGDFFELNPDNQYKIAVKGTDGNYYGVLVLE